MICYESIFSPLALHYRRTGADFFVNITHDAWFGREVWWSRSSALWQHPAHLVMRAIETRAGVARSANTGISEIVDPLGRISHETPLFERAAFAGEVMTTDGRTLYVRFGDVVGWGAVLLAIMGLIQSMWKARTANRGSE
jgi:apolipoprotein N-acyltransferase